MAALGDDELRHHHRDHPLDPVGLEPVNVIDQRAPYVPEGGVVDLERMGYARGEPLVAELLGCGGVEPERYRSDVGRPQCLGVFDRLQRGVVDPRHQHQDIIAGGFDGAVGPAPRISLGAVEGNVQHLDPRLAQEGGLEPLQAGLSHDLPQALRLEHLGHHQSEEVVLPQAFAQRPQVFLEPGLA